MSEAAKDTQAPRMMDAPTPAECAEDAQFFADHPQRPFRVGERWVTRWCRGGVYLRAPLPPSYSYVNTEAAAERAWWICAWPDSIH